MPRWGGSLGDKDDKDQAASSPSKQPLSSKPNAETPTKKKVKTKHNIGDESSAFSVAYIKQFSPRSHEAMRREGIIPREITFKALEWFESRLPSSSNKDIARIRFNHHQNKRKGLIRTLKATRLSLMAQSWSPMPTLAKNAKRGGRLSRSASHSASHTTSRAASRPASRLSHTKTNTSSTASTATASSRQQTYRGSGSGGSNESRAYAKELERCLLSDNMTMIDMNLAHIGLSKLEIKTINRILKPRKVKRKQSQRKNFVDKSWQRLQTVLAIK